MVDTLKQVASSRSETSIPPMPNKAQSTSLPNDTSSSELSRPSRNKPTISSLTGLRFFAAIHVVIYHNSRYLEEGIPWIPNWALNFVHVGYSGVNLFFVLSGFILAYTYASGSGQLRTSLARFWVARVARIYPLYLFSLGLSAPLVVHHFLSSNDPLIASMKIILSGSAVLTLTQAWIPSLRSIWNAPSWSLSAEAYFYLVFPFLLGAIWRSPKRIVFAIAVGCLLFAFIPWAIAYLYLDPEIHRATAVEPIPANDWAVFIRSSPLFRVHEFILGIAFARLTLDDDPGGNIRKRFHRFPSLSLILSALVLIIVVIDRIPRLLIHAGILDAFYLLLIAHLLAGRGGLVRILESRVFVRLGEASYGIYILHIPIRNLMLSASDEAGTTLAGLPFLTLYIPIVIASSLLAFQWIEEPARRAINNRFQHHHSTHRPAGVR